MTLPGTQHLSRPAELASLPSLKAFVIAAAEEAGFTTDQCQRIELAVDELLTNVLLYAYPQGHGGVTISCRATPDALRVTITDQGRPFNPLTAPDPDLDSDLEQRQLGGLGIFLARRVANLLSYRRSETSNILTVCFSKESPEPAPQKQGE